METKKCNKCGKLKTIDMFFRLRKDREWRRSICKDCHKAKNKHYAKIRKGLLVLLLLVSTISIGQGIDQKRQSILDSINYYRSMPIKAETAYGVKIKYNPTHEWSLNEELNEEAQKYSDWMAKKERFGHSNHPKAKGESIALVFDSDSGHNKAVQLFIIDDGVPNKGHRHHLLGTNHKEVGIGISVSKQGDTYICLQTR